MKHPELSLHFAPLQGYTDNVYRNAFNRIFGGVDMFYTPFVRLERGTFRNKEIRDTLPGNNTTPLTPQLIAGTPEEFRYISALFVRNGYKQVDINMGCPFPIQVRKHKGAGILPFREEAEALLKAITEFPQLKFSVKMRLGWEQKDECLALLPLLNELPLEHITMHPRLGVQQYKGLTDKEAFSLFYNECVHPLYYNGDIRTVEDVQTVIAQFPRLKGIMIGRGLLANPFLASAAKSGKRFSAEEKRTLLNQFHAELFGQYKLSLEGNHQLLSRLKTIWDYLLPEAEKKLHKKISKSTRIEQYEDAVHTLLNQYPNV